MISLILAFLVLAIWLGLAAAHASFWRIDWTPVAVLPAERPDVVAVIPARDEEAGIGETLRSLWRQGYPGRLRIVVVDDHSEDHTTEVARKTAAELGHEAELEIVEADP